MRRGFLTPGGLVQQALNINNRLELLAWDLSPWRESIFSRQKKPC